MDTTNSGNIKSWTAVLEADGEDLILPLPEDMLTELGWKSGDTLQWHDQGDGTWTLRKKEQSAPGDS